MLLLAALAVGLAIGLATGGKLGNLANLRFRWPFVVVAALLIKEAVVLTSLSQIEGMQYVYAISLAALVAWTLWHVSRIPGVWLVSIGAAMNLLVVLANGGRMPVARELAALGRHILIDRGVVGQYMLMGTNTRLNWLADWIAIPGPLGTILPGAYSPGDLVIALGIGVVALLATRRRPGNAPGETSGRTIE